MTNAVKIETVENVAVIEVSNPPVNALSQAVRAGLADCVAQANANETVQAVVICCEGRTFIAGADIREFGKPHAEPSLPAVIETIEASAKPVVASLHGTVLGGGLEVALGAHYRIAQPNTRFGLPEVTLGLLPGAGGTQRLPRVVPVKMALDMITSGRQIKVAEAQEAGLVDAVADQDDPRTAGIAYAMTLLSEGKLARPTGALPCNSAEDGLFDTARATLAKKMRGQFAPQKCVDAIENATKLPITEGLAQERAFFQDLMNGDQRSALIHAFFSERQVGKLPEIKDVSPRDIAAIGVVGGGTMGAGIAVSSLLAGLTVTLIERDQASADRATSSVSKMLEGSVKRGKLSQAAFDDILANRFAATSDYQDLANADIVVEAVFESLEVKKDVFGQLDAICKPGAILASNTSYLDVNAIAEMTKRPEDVIGLHFFSPAHVMKLLEVVVADKTSAEVVATGFAFAKKLRKVAVRSGVCDGFIGNRLLSHYRQAMDGVVIAGASPYDVDRALVNFGMAMGPFSVADLAGLDIGWATRKRLAPTRDPREMYAEFSDRLCEKDRFGRKTGRGFYIYEDGKPSADPEVLEIIAAERTDNGVKAQEISDQEIVDRYMAAMINEAARVLEEGIALRPLDVDVTLLNGYGFPRWRGGPMQYADTVGLDKILNDIKRLSQEDDFMWQPAPLLERLVAEGKTFADLNG
ncbi:3-hydroxyacyl-CoA dehydrogenase NAD-binding domain-containing protein [Cognatishimia sp. WU-CL00825]|uniref:3-hydroxyacyl-CoA dehydrogenase NAD-binding domain-containing protein n=1 Tax=Cognatishimia sp. WU-CL00825 TaxID=3127658 RepID=UPI00310C12FB